MKTHVDWLKFRTQSSPFEVLETLKPSFIGELLELGDQQRGKDGWESRRPLVLADVTVGAIDYGACAFTVRDAPHLAQAGDLVVIAPGDVHTGGTSETPLGYRMLYVEPSWLDDHARALLGAAAAFDGPVIRDPALCAQYRELSHNCCA